MGVIGGLGPAATLDFFSRVIAATGARTDQEHLPILIHNDPRVPNRNEAMAGTGPSPGPALAQAAVHLERGGADFLVMPCNAAHAWVDEIRAASDLPFVSILDATAAAASHTGATTVGVLAADACLGGDLYPPVLRAAGMVPRVPTAANQARFMAVLGRIKRGDRSAAVRDEMTALAEALGADVVIAACTEIPLVLAQADVPVPLISSTDALVTAAIAHALAA